MEKVVLAGGTGNIGTALAAYLVGNGYEVIILSRSYRQNVKKNINFVHWDGQNIGEWVNSMEGSAAVINLSGKSIQCRFTEGNKKQLYSSRVEPTKLIGQAIDSLSNPPKRWINFSGISVFEGIDSFNDESSTLIGRGFLSYLTQEWENVFFDSKTPQTEKVCLRISPVLSKNYGMLMELYPLTKLGLGGTVGDGHQMISWIHEEDLLRMLLWILRKSDVSGLYHACVPRPISNKEFMKMLRASVGVPVGLTLPSFMAKLGAFVKGVESDMLLNTNNVGTNRTLEEGFEFNYPNAKEAFIQLLNTK